MVYSAELQDAINRFYGGNQEQYEANVARARAASQHEQTVAELEEAQARADSGEHINSNGL